MVELSSCSRCPFGPQSLTYLLSGTLKKKFVDLCLNYYLLLIRDWTQSYLLTDRALPDRVNDLCG